MSQPVLIDMSFTLTREPGEYPELTAEQAAEGLAQYLDGEYCFLTDQMIPYRIKVEAK